MQFRTKTITWLGGQTDSEPFNFDGFRFKGFAVPADINSGTTLTFKVGGNPVYDGEAAQLSITIAANRYIVPTEAQMLRLAGVRDCVVVLDVTAPVAGLKIPVTLRE